MPKAYRMRAKALSVCTHGRGPLEATWLAGADRAEQDRGNLIAMEQWPEHTAELSSPA